MTERNQEHLPPQQREPPQPNQQGQQGQQGQHPQLMIQYPNQEQLPPQPTQRQTPQPTQQRQQGQHPQFMMPYPFPFPFPNNMSGQQFMGFPLPGAGQNQVNGGFRLPIPILLPGQIPPPPPPSMSISGTGHHNVVVSPITNNEKKKESKKLRNNGKKKIRKFRGLDGKYLTKKKLEEVLTFAYKNRHVTSQSVTHPIPTVTLNHRDTGLPNYIKQIMGERKTLGFGMYMSKIGTDDHGEPELMSIRVKNRKVDDCCKSQMFSILQLCVDETSWDKWENIKVPIGLYLRGDEDLDDEDEEEEENSGDAKPIIVTLYKRKLKCKGVFVCDNPDFPKCEGRKCFTAVAMNGDVGRKCKYCGSEKVHVGSDCHVIMYQVLPSKASFEFLKEEIMLVFGNHETFHGFNPSWKIPSPMKRSLKELKRNNPSATTSQAMLGYGMPYIPSEIISSAENRDAVRNIMNSAGKDVLGDSVFPFERMVLFLLNKVKELEKAELKTAKGFKENVIVGEGGKMVPLTPKQMKDVMTIQQYQQLNLCEYLRRKKENSGAMVKSGEMYYIFTMTRCVLNMFVEKLLDIGDSEYACTARIDSTYKNLKEMIKTSISFFSKELSEEVTLNRTIGNGEVARFYRHVFRNTINCVMDHPKVKGKYRKIDIIKMIIWIFDFAQSIFTGLFQFCCEETKTVRDAYALLQHIIQGCIFHSHQLANKEAQKQKYENEEYAAFLDCYRDLTKSQSIQEINSHFKLLCEKFPKSRDFIVRRTTVLELVRTCPTAFEEYFENETFAEAFEKRRIVLDRTGSRLENLHHTQGSTDLMSMEGAFRRDMDIDLGIVRRFYNLEFKGGRSKYNMMSEEKRALVRLTGKKVGNIGRKQVLEQLKIVTTKRGAKNKGPKEKRPNPGESMSGKELSNITGLIQQDDFEDGERIRRISEIDSMIQDDGDDIPPISQTGERIRKRVYVETNLEAETVHENDRKRKKRKKGGNVDLACAMKGFRPGDLGNYGRTRGTRGKK